MRHSIESLRVLGAGIFSLILTLGIARFAYTPLLPVMQGQTWLDDAGGGWLATFNYMGYMTGALIAASVSDLVLKDRLYRGGLVIAVLSTALMAFTEDQVLWSILRFIAGLSSAAGLLIGSGLILNWLIRHQYRNELGIHFSGLGLGIVLTAVAVEWMISRFDWSEQWLAFALIGVVLMVPAWRWLPRPDTSPIVHNGKQVHDTPPDRNWMLLLFASYFCAGVGYVVSATFVVTLVEARPSLQGYGWLAWLVVGLAAAPACFFWDLVARRIGDLKALLIAYGFQIVGILLPALDDRLPMVLLSALLYGGTFIGIVSLMLTMVGRFFPSKPAKPMGKLTLSYGVAQIVAPAISGVMAQQTGSYDGSLYMASAVMVLGMLLMLMLMLMLMQMEHPTDKHRREMAG
ncbi:YbfB/YjiJ family MFS transporter [Solemya velesiana gill symbiont]|uniref:MFS transporter n=1 Tax=Solemya velesiana gill symbiont TaxID=1918948 RepID=A0A1T2KUZ3_9GAMM|nr:YbfB/YjiJ family MFS transporter [Solemya velesiana gill symbiont]OOZ36683.1 MFS transporter [Solemya velesiana gill symbiont]